MNSFHFWNGFVVGVCVGTSCVSAFMALLEFFDNRKKRPKIMPDDLLSDSALPILTSIIKTGEQEDLDVRFAKNIDYFRKSIPRRRLEKQ